MITWDDEDLERLTDMNTSEGREVADEWNRQNVPEPFDGLYYADLDEDGDPIDISVIPLPTPVRLLKIAAEGQIGLPIGTLVRMFAKPFRWNEAARRYIDPKGRFVAEMTVRKVLEESLLRNASRISSVTRRLMTEEIDVEEWQLRMSRAVRGVHTIQTGLAKGGYSKLTLADYRALQEELQFQHEHLQRFARQIEAGKQAKDGYMLRRAQMYAEAGRRTYFETYKRFYMERGFVEAQNLQYSAEGCSECNALTQKGWIKAQEMPPVGSRICLTGCKCEIVLRDPETGETSMYF